MEPIACAVGDWTHRRLSLSLSLVRVRVNVLAYVPTSRRDRYKWPIREEKRRGRGIGHVRASGRAWSGHRGEFRSPKRRERNEIGKRERFVSETHVSANSLSAALSRPRRGAAPRFVRNVRYGRCVRCVRALVRPPRHVRGKRDAGHEKKYRPIRSRLRRRFGRRMRVDRHYSWNAAASWPLKLSFTEARDKSSVARKIALTETAFHLTQHSWNRFVLVIYRMLTNMLTNWCPRVVARINASRSAIFEEKRTSEDDNFEDV